MMNDLNYLVEGLQQFASQEITYGVPVAGVKASDILTITGAITPGSHALATLTSDTVQPADGEQIVVGSKTYTFKTTLTGAADEILIDIDPATMLDNVKLAVNAGAGAGTKYGTGTTANAEAIATTNTNTTQLFQARTPGTAGNAYASTETSAHLSFGDVTFAGGVAEETVVVGGKTYSFVDALTETSGATAIVNQVLYGGSDAIALDNLKVAINAGATAGTNYSTGTTANANVLATTNTNTAQTVEALAEGVAGNSIAATETLANGAWAAATLLGGVDGDTIDVNGTVMTCVTSSPGTHEFSSIAELTILIAAVTGIDATDDGDIITVVAEDVGAAGNAITLELGVTNAGTMTLGGETLEGGVDATYTDWLQIPEEASSIRAMFKVAGLTTNGAVEITSQTSMDKDNVTDITTQRFEANGVQNEEIGNLSTWFRFKIVMDDSAVNSPEADITISAQPGVASKDEEHDFYLSSELEVSGVAKEAPGLFYGIECIIDGSAASDDYFVFVYDAPVVPTNGATLDAAKLLMVPRKLKHATGTDSQASFDYDGAFKRASYGICWFVATSDSLTLALAGSDVAKVTIEND